LPTPCCQKCACALLFLSWGSSGKSLMKQTNGKQFKVVVVTDVVNMHEPTERIFLLKFIVNVNCQCDTGICWFHVVMFNMFLLLKISRPTLSHPMRGWGAMPKARHCDLTCQPHVVKVCVCSASCLSEGRRTKTYATVIAQQNSQIQKPACDSVPWFRFGYQESVDIVCWCSVDTSENVPVTMFGLLLVWRLEAMSVIIFASYIVFKLYC
jgi:hypothetical protein